MTDDAGADALVIRREFDAPVGLLWQMWTEPEHFSSWYGPAGASVRVTRMDVRVGGTRLICMQMQTPDGERQMWFTGEYREVVANSRLVYTDSMCDERGEPLPSPATVVTVEFEALAGRTTVVLTHAGVAPDSPGAIGWRMALDALSATLADLTS